MVGAEQMAVKNANTNPWYVLMTLYGEQGESGFGNSLSPDYEPNLHDRNRRLWNAWVGKVLLSSNHAQVDTKVDITESEFAVNEFDWGEIRNRHESEMMKRNPSRFQYPGFPEDKSEISLVNIEFHRPVCWERFYFPLVLNVTGSTFKKGVIFSNAEFAQGACLKNVNFLDTTTFNKSRFRAFELNDVRFSGVAIFTNAEFKESVIFNNVRFESASFLNAKYVTKHPGRELYSLNIMFSNIIFEKQTDFSYSKFGDRARFNDVVFHGVVFFDSSTFQSAVDFSGTKFHERVSFKKAQFPLNYCVTGSHKYIADISFETVSFKAPTSFEEALFVNVWPSFEGTVLHSDSVFTPKDDYWPRVTGESDPIGHKTCSKIRKNQSIQGLIDGEHFFFRRVMDFQLNSCSRGMRLLFRGYGFFSDFGRSISRPLWSIFFLWLLGVFAIAGYLSSCSTLLPEETVQRPWLTAVALSFSNLFPMFGFGRTYLDWVDLPTVLEVYSAIQTVFSLPLLFFLGLGLRQQFKIDR